MVTLPQRRQHATRDEFAAAVTAAFGELYAEYEAEPVSQAKPDWARYAVSLPIGIAHEGAAAHGISSIIKHAIEMNKSSIGRIARVEHDGQWTVFFEAT